MENNAVRINSAWNVELSHYVINGCDHLASLVSTISRYMHIVSKETGVPPELIAGTGLGGDEKIVHAKTCFLWLLENVVELSRDEIMYFVGGDIKIIHSLLGKHYEFLRSKDKKEDAKRYFCMYQKVINMSSSGNTLINVCLPSFLRIPYNVKSGPLEAGKNNKDFIANFIMTRISKYLDVTIDILVSGGRKDMLVLGRYVFIAIMKDFLLDEISNKEISTYLRKDNPATTVVGLRNHARLFETGYKKYTNMYNFIYGECRSHALMKKNYIPCTVDTLCGYLSRKKVPVSKIDTIKEMLTTRLQSLYVFSDGEISKILFHAGVAHI